MSTLYQKGSITIYLCLTLLAILSVITAAVYSVQSAGARVQAVHAADQGLYSLFARYDIPMLEQYHLFFMDGSKGGTAVEKANEFLQEDVKNAANRYERRTDGIIDNPVFKSNSITACTLATDNGGNAIKSQAVSCMKAMLGMQGVQSLIDKVQGNKDTIYEIENSENPVDESEAMQTYEDIKSGQIDSGVESSEAETSEVISGDSLVLDENSEESTVEIPDDFMDPVSLVQEAKSQPILELVLPDGMQVSGLRVDSSKLLSARKQQQGFGSPVYDDSCDSLTSKILFNEYVLRHFPSFISKDSGEGLQYQLEYILYGKDSDAENLEAVSLRLLAIREIANAIYLAENAGKQTEIKTVSLILATLLGAPQAAEMLEPALLLVWAFGESVLDLQNLLAGEKTALMKSDETWQLSLLSLPKIFGGISAFRKSSEEGMSYKDYLRVFLLTGNEDTVLTRSMDMMEIVLRKKENHESFCLDACVYSIDTEMIFTTKRGSKYITERSYGYDMQ